MGRVLPGNELKILPPDGDAEDGEIAIRGPIVMQGYFNRPDATAAVMRDGWFLTGDLGRVDADGRVTITGRKKEMIVLASGKNIYPEEIEAHYRKSTVIEEICVMGVTRPDEPTTERLHAVIVLDQDVLKARKIVNAGDLLRFEMEGLGATLPAYKRVLGYDVWFEPLPRTTTGKLRRFAIQRRLKDQAAARQVEASAPVSAADQEWLDDAHVGAALSLVTRRAKDGAERQTRGQSRARSGPRQHGAGRTAHRVGAPLRGEGARGRLARDLHRAPARRGGPSSGRGAPAAPRSTRPGARCCGICHPTPIRCSASCWRRGT